MKLTDVSFGWPERKKVDAAAMLIAALEAVHADGLASDERSSFLDAVTVAEALLDECKTSDVDDLKHTIQEIKK